MVFIIHTVEEREMGPLWLDPGQRRAEGVPPVLNVKAN
jgi:hypothetical protein